MGNKVYLSHCVDLYVLEALSLQTASTIPQERFIERVSEVKEELTFVLAKTMRNYLVLACAGEIRHSEYHNGTSIEGLRSTRQGRSAAVDAALEFDPDALLSSCADMFRNRHWSSSFGGEKWAEIADFAMKYGRVPDGFFVDHIVDVAHNGGVLFNKGEALSVVGMRVNVNECEFRRFCDVKSGFDLLADDTLPFWAYQYLTFRVFSLVKKYYMLWFQSEPPSCWTQCEERVEWPELTEVTFGTRTPEVCENVNVGEEAEDESCGTACNECGYRYDRDDMYYMNGTYYCEDCYSSKYSTCDHCGEVVRADSTCYIVDAEENWCEHCANHEAVKCENCGKLFSSCDSLTYVEHTDSYYCEDCLSSIATTCPVCGEPVIANYGTHVTPHITVHDECVADYDQDPYAYAWDGDSNVPLPGILESDDESVVADSGVLY